MTGEQHYRTAEQLLAQLANPDLMYFSPSSVIAQAQVHATLALAAAQSHVPAQDDYPARQRYGADAQ
jgi:hypothetical protein